MTLRDTWSSGNDTLGLWLSLPSSVSAEIVARSDPDYVCIDMQHGIIGYQQAVSMVQAIELGGATPIVRVPWNEPGIVGKVLDAGAHGVIAPMVNTADQAAALVRACRYPPGGTRSWGPVFPGARHGDARGWAAENVAVIPMIETVEALDNLDAILMTPGVDAIYVGPADLSLSLGLSPGNNDGEAAFDDALRTIVEACDRHGVIAGIHATGALTPVRQSLGFRMITVTSDLLALKIGLATELGTARASTTSSTNDMY